MNYFVRMLEENIMTEVIEVEWTAFRKSLSKASLFEEIVTLHNRYLDTITEKCFLERGTGKLLISLNSMFRQVLSFSEVVRDYPGIQLCTDQDPKIEME
jgi:hypothetical protein